MKDKLLVLNVAVTKDMYMQYSTKTAFPVNIKISATAFDTETTKIKVNTLFWK